MNAIQSAATSPTSFSGNDNAGDTSGLTRQQAGTLATDKAGVLSAKDALQKAQKLQAAHEADNLKARAQGDVEAVKQAQDALQTAQTKLNADEAAFNKQQGGTGAGIAAKTQEKVQALEAASSSASHGISDPTSSRTLDAIV